MIVYGNKFQHTSCSQIIWNSANVFEVIANLEALQVKLVGEVRGKSFRTNKAKAVRKRAKFL
jgi:hypothetical protein